MTRPLNLRVEDEFAEKLKALSKKIGRPMEAMLETIGAPAIEAAEADIQFEAETFATREEFELTGICDPAEKIGALFDHALARVMAVSEKKRG